MRSTAWLDLQPEVTHRIRNHEQRSVAENGWQLEEREDSLGSFLQHKEASRPYSLANQRLVVSENAPVHSESKARPLHGSVAQPVAMPQSQRHVPLNISHRRELPNVDQLCLIVKTMAVFVPHNLENYLVQIHSQPWVCPGGWFQMIIHCFSSSLKI